MAKPVLLIIEDEKNFADICAEVAAMAGFQHIISCKFEEYSCIIQDNEPDVILMDIVMPDKEGMELILWLSEQKCQSHIIVMSGYGKNYLQPAKALAENYGLNIVTTLDKPFKIDTLRSILVDLNNNKTGSD